jgi:cell division protein FtsW
MFFVAGLRRGYLGAIVVLAGAAATLAVIVEPFRWRRVVEYVLALFGLAEPGYQVQQSWIALGSGGPLGVGLGQGHQQAFFLPAAHTDFIYSVVGEELGLLGTLGILAGFLLIFWRGLRTVVRTADPFGAYLALGLTILIVCEALLHICVCVGLVPPTGLALPFISYGGSSLVASILAVALLLNVSQECNIRACL